MNAFDRFLSASCILSRRVYSVAIIVFALTGVLSLRGSTASAIAQDTSNAGTTSSPGTGAPNAPAAPRRSARKPFRAARLTYLEGEVRVEQASSPANSAAVVNMPLVEGTVISSGADGQAEIEFEDGSLARLTPNSGLSLLNLSVDSSGSYQTRIALLGGLAYFELRAGTRYIYTVDVGGDVISPVENATIRINFDEPPAVVAVLDGTAHLVSAGGSNTDATAGQTVQTNADADSQGSTLMVKQMIAPETWDRWNEDRDAIAANESDSQTDARTNFAGSQGYGWSDLDANGSWYDVPGHGKVWQPDIAATQDGSAGTSADQAQGQTPDQSADQFGDQPTDPSGDLASGDANGFDPYGFGSWAYTPVGYAWASGYGWGWLPYRCGLWSFYSGFGWGWSPNSYCGSYGFAGFGYGYGYGGGLNFGTVPPHYRRPHRPIPGPGPIHPILRGRSGGPVPVVPVHALGGDRAIAGTIVQRLQPIDSGFAQSGGSVLGSALRRDYPIDSRTHTPVTGLFAATPFAPAAGSNARAAWQSGSTAYGEPRSPYAPLRPLPGQTYEGLNHSTPGNRPAPTQGQRQSARPAQRSSAPAAAHSAPAASSSSKGK